MIQLIKKKEKGKLKTLLYIGINRVLQVHDDCY